MNTKLNRMSQPSDPYDTAAWMKFYAENPGFNRSVGAAGDNDEADAEAAAAAKAKSEADAAAAVKAKEEADAAAAADAGNAGPTDTEAALLKDMMKHKQAKVEAERKAAELQKQYGDINIDEYNEMIAARADAAAAKAKTDEDAAIAAGDFEKVRTQMSEQHDAALEALRVSSTAEAEDLRSKLAKSASVIEELTVGSHFNTSKFIGDDTIYTASKARRLYGDHFEVDAGKVIPYNLPRGSEGREILVDAKGNSAGFDEAMRRIIEADPEKDEILLGKMRPGAGSAPGKGAQKKEETPATSRDKIMSGMTDLLKNIGQPNDDIFK
tara:strand:- start:17528 stop:18502 length:975 start_codon:yes stop_codon:yes gene_type:complete